MLSQLGKTIKLALKSTEEERAILRARSAVQRFPVVEWRQRMEDFHKRSINTSRSHAAENAWRAADCDEQQGIRRVELDAEDWDPVHQAEPSQPDWDARSIDSPRLSSPGSPGQWSQTTPPVPYDNRHGQEQQFLDAPPRFLAPNDRRRGSFSTDVSENDDYFARPHSNYASGIPPSEPTTPSGDGYGNFLAKANRVIAKEQKHVADPFLDSNAAPSRPFGNHSRVSSVESIASIVDEKANSPLNKAIASVSSIAV